MFRAFVASLLLSMAVNAGPTVPKGYYDDQCFKGITENYFFSMPANAITAFHATGTNGLVSYHGVEGKDEPVVTIRTAKRTIIFNGEKCEEGKTTSFDEASGIIQKAAENYQQVKKNVEGQANAEAKDRQMVQFRKDADKMKQTLANCSRSDNEKIRNAAKAVGEKLFAGTLPKPNDHD